MMSANAAGGCSRMKSYADCRRHAFLRRVKPAARQAIGVYWCDGDLVHILHKGTRPHSCEGLSDWDARHSRRVCVKMGHERLELKSAARMRKCSSIIWRRRNG